MLSKPGNVVLTMCLGIGFGSLLSGCLVEKQDPATIETISRTTNILHIYQPGEYIEYNLTADDISNNTTTQGVLRVEWTQPVFNLQDPISGDSISTLASPVLKETTTLWYEDGDADADAVVIRYISQVSTATPDQGSIILHAIDDGTGTPTDPTLYWPYDPNNVGTPSSDVIAPVIFSSPMAVGVTPANSPLEFSIMANCGTGLCGDEIYKFSETFTVDGDSTTVSTEQGKFADPFQISFDGNNIPKNSLSLSVLGDIRHACGDSEDNITHLGNMYVMPEIGIIRMTNYCQVTSGSGSSVYYTLNLRSTNIQLP